MAMWSTAKGHHSPFVSFIRADRPITWAAQKIHGISSDDLSDAPAFMTLWPRIKAVMGGNIAVAHGHGTEKRYLRAFPAHGFGPWVDTLQLARAAWPNLSSHALGEICKHFNLTGKVTELVPNKAWHDALYDAAASLILLEYLVNEFKLSDSPIDLLLSPDTSKWHRLRH